MTPKNVTPVLPTADTTLRPASLGSVRLEGGFWGERQELNKTVTLPHEMMWLEKSGALGNFDAAVAGTVAQTRIGREFSDSDVYKVAEALAWEEERSGDPFASEAGRMLLERVLPALEKDGYLSTKFGRPGQAPRYSDMEWGHELYCYGHLIQGGVARMRAGHDENDPLVALTLRVADHVCETFGEDGLQKVCGHPGIEVALAELYRATGDQKYLHQAALFIDRRGHGTLGPIEFGQEYFQDATPFREIETMHGHAVRALYLAAGAVDVAIEQGDADLLEAARRQYANTLERRTYITGGMGSHHQDEAFGEDFELPSDRAYCETCAGVGSIMVAWRLLLATGDLSYGDIIERTLYNLIATALGEGGNTFFYANPLHQRTAGNGAPAGEKSLRAGSSHRESWFEVPCCPPNISRTLAQLASYVATSDDRGVQLIQYMSGVVELGGAKLQVRTEYPQDGRVLIRVEEAPQSWVLTLRIPEWAKGATVNGKPARAPSFSVTDLKRGDEVCLELPLSPRFIFPDPRIDAVRGCLAVTRGPLVFCAQSADQESGVDIERFRVDPTIPIVELGSALVVQGVVLTDPTRPGLYSEAPFLTEGDAASLVLTPYWDWGNKGPTAMRVWLPTV